MLSVELSVLFSVIQAFSQGLGLECCDCLGVFKSNRMPWTRRKLLRRQPLVTLQAGVMVTTTEARTNICLSQFIFKSY